MSNLPPEPAVLDAPAEETATNPTGDQAESKSTAKRGGLYGGALTDEALSSSRRVLSRARGNKQAFVGQDQKRCAKCGEVKPLRDFHWKRRASQDSRCKGCKSEQDKSRYNQEKRQAVTSKKRLLKEQGLCVSCGKAPVSPEHSKVRCAKCAESSRIANAKHRKKARKTLFEVYGGPTCACCGETEERFLSFDHVNEDGAQHRLSIGKRANGRGFSDVVSLHRTLKKAGYPPVIQVLCFNCNIGKHFNGGLCPHKEVGR